VCRARKVGDNIRIRKPAEASFGRNRTRPSPVAKQTGTLVAEGLHYPIGVICQQSWRADSVRPHPLHAGGGVRADEAAANAEAAREGRQARGLGGGIESVPAFIASVAKDVVEAAVLIQALHARAAAGGGVPRVCNFLGAGAGERTLPG
jgi:hypothetical protein